MKISLRHNSLIKIKRIRQDITSRDVTIFVFFFLIYGFLGYLVAYHTNLYTPSKNAGSYLGYDNIFHTYTNGGAFDISHPFFNLIHFVKALIAKLLSPIIGNGKVLVSILLSDISVSFGLSVLYKYLREVVSLPSPRASLLTLFTGFSFTTIVLSFTMDSYPFSFSFLILSIYILSLKYKKGEYASLRTTATLSFLCGGITITNFAKPLSTLLLNKTSFKNNILNISKIAIPFIISVITVGLIYWVKSAVTNDPLSNPVSKAISLGNYLRHDKDFLNDILIDFFGNTFLTTPLTLSTEWTETALRPSTYQYWWQPITISAIFLIAIISAIANRKKYYIKVLLLYLSVDILINIICGYGLNEGVIFGGHWLFIIPMLIGWSYSTIHRTQNNIIDITLILVTIIMAYENLHALFSVYVSYE